MQNDPNFSCAYCGETNSIFIDISAGLEQSYIEDCQVCCQPNILYIQINENSLEIEINTEPES